MSKLIKSIYHPFKYFRLDTRRSLIWVLFTIICGMIGIGMNVWSHMSSEVHFYEAVLKEFSVNSFYTYSIVLLSCTAGTLFMKIEKDKMVSFTGIQIWLLIILSAFVFAGGFLCQSPEKLGRPFWIQFVFFVLSVLVAVYGFCVVNLDKYPDEFVEIQECISEEEANSMKAMIDKMKTVTKDSKGNKI